MSKIDIRKILKDHWVTLVYDHSGKYNPWDFLTFYGIPIAISALLLWFGILFGKTISSALTTAFSVFAALLFNVLILIYDIVRKSNGTQNVSSLKNRFLRQIYSNVAYSVLVSITLIALLLLYYLVLSLGNRWLPFTYFAAFCVYALAANFILTILMVLKRLHILLSKEFDAPEEKPSSGNRKTA